MRLAPRRTAENPGQAPSREWSVRAVSTTRAPHFASPDLSATPWRPTSSAPKSGTVFGCDSPGEDDSAAPIPRGPSHRLDQGRDHRGQGLRIRDPVGDGVGDPQAHRTGDDELDDGDGEQHLRDDRWREVPARMSATTAKQGGGHPGGRDDADPLPLKGWATLAQYLAIRRGERLAEAGAVASVGSKGDSHVNAGLGSASPSLRSQWRCGFANMFLFQTESKDATVCTTAGAGGFGAPPKLSAACDLAFRPLSPPETRATERRS